MQGSCFCGAIVFTVTGDIPALYQCHCSECRKTTGAAANAAFIVHRDSFHWVQGEGGIKTFLKASGFRVCFCSECGSTVPNVISSIPQAMWVPAGAMDDELPGRVMHHLFVGSKAHWDVIGGDAMQHDGMPENMADLLPESLLKPITS